MNESPIVRLCECGCGEPTSAARQTNIKRGRVKGQPLRFIHGHNRRGKEQYKPSAEESARGGENKKGYKYSEEHKRQIREQKLATGFKGPTYGMKQSAETKAKQRNIAIAKEQHLHFPNNICPETGRWKGGGEVYYKRIALKRDDYTCQVCGMRDEEIMQIDHIKPKALYPELGLVLENMQTLCPNCHARKTIREKKEIFRIKRERKSQCG